MNKNYEAGRRFEYETMKKYRTLGYVVLRTAGSHGFADIVAAMPKVRVDFIQCKVTESESVAKKLVRDFTAKPPLLVSPNYRQTIVVKVKRGETLVASV